MNAKVMGKEGDDPFYGAPVVLVVLADKSKSTYLYDGSLVMGNLMLAAYDQGWAAAGSTGPRRSSRAKRAKPSSGSWASKGITRHWPLRAGISRPGPAGGQPPQGSLCVLYQISDRFNPKKVAFATFFLYPKQLRPAADHPLPATALKPLKMPPRGLSPLRLPSRTWP